MRLVPIVNRRADEPPVPVNAMVEVFALNVRLVAPLWVKKTVEPENVQVPPPIFNVLVPEPVLVKLPVIVILLLFAEKSSVPVWALQVSDCIERVALVVTTPPPDEASKVTSSPATGAD